MGRFPYASNELVQSRNCSQYRMGTGTAVAQVPEPSADLSGSHRTDNQARARLAHSGKGTSRTSRSDDPDARLGMPCILMAPYPCF
jgi:hypothetical protein